MKKLYVIILLLTIVLRVLYLTQLQKDTIISQNPIVDEISYDRWAQEISTEDFWGDQIFYQSPFYPYFLGVIYRTFGRNLLIVRMIQMFVGVLTLFLIYRLTSMIVTEKAGLIALAIGAFYSLFPYYESLILKDIFAPFFIILFVWLLFKWAKEERAAFLLLSGASLGLLSLVRENLIVLAIPTTIYLLLKYKKQKPMSIFLAGFLIIICPVGIRNYIVGKEFAITSSQFGANFYIGNSRYSSGIYAQVPFVRASPLFEETDFRQEAERRAGGKLTPQQVSSFWFKESLKFIRSEPARWLKLTGKKILYFIGPFEIADNRSLYLFKERFPSLRIFWVNFATIISLGFLGMLLSLKEYRKFILLYVIILVVFFGTVAFFVVARYRFPITPFLIIFAGYYLNHLYNIRKKIPEVFFHIIGLVACFIFFNVNFVKYDVRRNEFVPGYHNIGYSYFESKDYDNALLYLKKALKLNPHSMEARNIVGDIYKSRNMLSEAIREFEIAQNSDHLHVRTVALLNLGEIYIRKGELQKAKDYLNRALEAKPDDYYPNLYLGNAFYEEGNYSECLKYWEKAQQANPNDKNLEENIRALRASTIPAP